MIVSLLPVPALSIRISAPPNSCLVAEMTLPTSSALATSAGTPIACRRYVEAELPRVVAGRSGALPGRLILSKTVQAAVADTWMVVEAIPERLDPKRKMFGDLDRLAPEDAILASNSSLRKAWDLSITGYGRR